MNKTQLQTISKDTMTKKYIYFITSTSGVGKTTLIEELKKKYADKTWAFLHFDSIVGESNH